MSERSLSGTQHEIHVHLVIGKDAPSILSAMNIAMNGFHIATDAAGDLAYRDRAGAGHRPQPRPPLRRADLPQKLGRRETDEGALHLALEGAAPPRLRGFRRVNPDRHRRHPRLHASICLRSNDPVETTLRRFNGVSLDLDTK